MMKTAMILAAGLGTRMRPLTDTTPKPMLVVAGRPLIEHHVRKLVKAGFKHVVINHAYLGEQIEAHLKDGRELGCQIEYSAEQEPLETGGGIYQALSKLTRYDDYFCVVNGDVWIDMDYSELHQYVLKEQAHLWLVPNPEHHPDGDFALIDGLVQLKDVHESAASYTFSGVSVLHKDVFNDCEAGAFKLAPLLKGAMKKHAVSGSVFHGYWLDVGTPQRLQDLEAHLQMGGDDE